MKSLPWSRFLQPPGIAWRRIGVFEQFKVVFALALVLVTVILGVVVRDVVVRAAAEHAAEEGAIFLAGFLQPWISTEGGEEVLSDESKQMLDRLLPLAYISQEHVPINFALVRIWSPEGELLYAADESQAGFARPPAAAIEQAKNDAFTMLQADLDGIDPRLSQTSSGEFIGMIAPLHAMQSGKIIAILETYQDRAFISGELRQWRGSTWSVILLVSAVLLGCLYLYAVRANSTIEAQRRELVEHLDAARRLADENAKLTAAAEASRSQISLSNDRFLERIGSDIHDGPLQTLSAILMALRAAPVPAGSTGNAVARCAADPVVLSLDLYDELREIAAGLVLPDIKEGSLENAIIQAAIRHEQKTGTPVDYRSRALPDEVADTVKVNCYRILQEALTNAYKHAGGVGQRVRAVAIPGYLRLIVSDAGPGLERPTTARRRLGLVGIRNRVTALKGKLEIRSGQGRGTCLRVTIPLTGQEGYEEDSDGSP